MKLKLQKTLLSSKITWPSLCVGIMSFCLIFIFQLLPEQNFSGNFDLIINQGQWWRAFTTTFVHADLKHFGSNALFFTILSVIVHQYFGWFIHPVISLLVGGLINLITLSFYPTQTFLVGISGVVYFMGAFWMTMLFLIERKETLARRLLHTTALCLILFFPDLFNERVSHLAHATGFVLGFFTALLYFKIFKSQIRSKEEWIVIEEEPEFNPEEIPPTECEACSS